MSNASSDQISPAREKLPSAVVREASSSPVGFEAPRNCALGLATGPPPFEWSSLWRKPVVNPINLKSQTLPMFNLGNQYGINFHLAWLGFFVAFLSWFAFPPLIPEAIKQDLRLTTPQVGNSNITALSATLIVRLISGPLVDRYGPRKVMAGLLVIGAIPSGMAGLVTNLHGFYAIRFFIGILGGTVVPCLAWTTCFFDSNIVGTANAFAGGWGNLGGGATFAVMVALFESLHRERGLTSSQSWRVAFAVVPVPILLFVALLTMVFGTDHPTGKWENRHLMQATAAAALQGHHVVLDESEARAMKAKANEKNTTNVQVAAAEDDVDLHGDDIAQQSKLAVAVNEKLTMALLWKILINPLTWLPSLAYATTFGFELAVDSNLHNVFLASHPSLGQLNAGFAASVFGLMNIWTRPMGGIVADMLYKKYGVRSKVYFTLALGVGQGIFCLAFGGWLKTGTPTSHSLGGMMGFVIVIAIFNEFANGANYSLVPHCNANSNGTMTGMVGAFGNVGGIIFALVWRFHPKVGDAWLISGGIALAINALLFATPLKGLKGH